eukprot:7278729-Lingulodinium_polyedra.AAC.1
MAAARGRRPWRQRGQRDRVAVPLHESRVGQNEASSLRRNASPGTTALSGERTGAGEMRVPRTHAAIAPSQVRSAR